MWCRCSGGWVRVMEYPLAHVDYRRGPMPLVISLSDQIEELEVVSLYRSNVWSSADKPVELLAALRNSHGLVTARKEGRLVGLGNAISDGSLVVYFPHLLVHSEFQRRGIGRQMFEALLTRYSGFHQLMITADSRAVAFYEAMGFTRAGNSVPMWIYAGTEH
jgi:GNAT superfamily N-acetyltransferase